MHTCNLLNFVSFSSHDCSVILLCYHTFYGDLSFQVSDNLLNASLGTVHTVMRSLQHHAVTFHTTAREADRHTAVIISNLSQNLAATGNKVSVVFGIYVDFSLNDVIQIFDEFL